METEVKIVNRASPTKALALNTIVQAKKTRNRETRFDLFSNYLSVLFSRSSFFSNRELVLEWKETNDKPARLKLNNATIHKRDVTTLKKFADSYGIKVHGELNNKNENGFSVAVKSTSNGLHFFNAFYQGVSAAFTEPNHDLENIEEIAMTVYTKRYIFYQFLYLTY